MSEVKHDRVDSLFTLMEREVEENGFDYMGCCIMVRLPTRQTDAQAN
jgi:hypothetical protein